MPQPTEITQFIFGQPLRRQQQDSLRLGVPAKGTLIFGKVSFPLEREQNERGNG
jgi:hypothetical protein